MAKSNGQTKANRPLKTRALPKGFKAAPPIKNKLLRELLSGPDVTTSGGTHTVANGQPLLNGQSMPK